MEKQCSQQFDSTASTETLLNVSINYTHISSQQFDSTASTETHYRGGFLFTPACSQQFDSTASTETTTYSKQR